MAFEKNLDLVLISKNANPPVAKIMDYKKYKFEKRKKDKEKIKNTKIVQQKEIRLSSSIEKNDLQFKIKNARKFLEKGNKVKVSLSFKGRKLMNKDKGFETMNFFLKEVEDVAKIEKEPKLNGRFYDAYLAPKKNK